MKKPEGMVGFVSFEGSRFPFEFDEGQFVLKLYPPDEAAQEKYNSFLHTFKRLKQFAENANEWIPFEDLTGETGEGYRVCFHVSGDYGSRYGFLSFSVAWYFVCEKEYPDDCIRGFRLRGPEIDAFFPPDTLFHYDIQPADGILRARQFSVSAQRQEEADGGSFLLSPDLSARICLSSSAVLTRSQSPVTSHSAMTLLFSRAVGLPALLHAHEQLYRFFLYVANRANLSLDTAEIFTLTQEGKRRFFGWLCFPAQFAPENSGKACKQIIGFSILGTKTADLLRAVSAGEIGYEHLPHSLDERRSYLVSRLILILAAFEREFRNIYGADAGRSELFAKAKGDIVQLVENHCAGKSGKEKQYAAELLRGIKAFSLGYRFRVEYALRDCCGIMDAFAARKYGTGRPYGELAEEIGRRVGDLRNGLAHDKLGCAFEAIQISDIQVIEALIYAIRLKQLGLEANQIQAAIQKLFGEA